MSLLFFPVTAVNLLGFSILFITFIAVDDHGSEN
jgi:hypothetical protein